MIPLDEQDVADLTATALAAVQQEYPHWLGQEVHADTVLLRPRELSPAFYGSYDWHSAVHNHWLLVRALDRGLPDSLALSVTSLLDDHLSPARLAGELEFFAGPSGTTNERPYGWAWLVMLHAECHALAGERYQRWAQALEPLATLFAGRLDGYFGGRLQFPIRSGTHGNTAFSLRLVIDAARRRGDAETVARLAGDAQRLYGDPHVLQWDGAASGDAFLTPELAEAALMADVLPAAEFAGWLDAAMPDPDRVAWAPPDFSPDAADPGTVHLEGLLVSRAWCLDAVVGALPPGHPIAERARDAAASHAARAAGIQFAEGFGRSHWMPTFLLYLDEQLRR
ncbi:MAG TPA: DUF2891 family protein [Trebonia sp.]|nr:DUF2891 family protein [Trebonia sp.]